MDCSEIFLKRYMKIFMENFMILYTFQWLLMLILLEILVILLFLTSGAQLQQAGVGTFSLLIIVAETLILVGMCISCALYYFIKCQCTGKAYRSTGSSCLMQISLLQISLLRFFKNYINLPYANFGLFYFISAIFGLIWLMWILANANFF